MKSGTCGDIIWAPMSLGGLSLAAPPPTLHMGSLKPSLLSAHRSVWQMFYILASLNILRSSLQVSLHIHSFTHRPLRTSLQWIQSHYTCSGLQQFSEALAQGRLHEPVTLAFYMLARSAPYGQCQVLLPARDVACSPCSWLQQAKHDCEAEFANISLGSSDQARCAVNS